MDDVPGVNQLPSNLQPPPLGSGLSQSRQSTPGSSDLHDIQKAQQGYSLPSPLQNHSSFQPQLQQQFYSQPQPQPRQNVLSPSQANMSHSQTTGRDSSFNMGPLGNALPDTGYHQGYAHQSPQRYTSGVSASAIVYQIPQQNTQYLSQAALTQPSNSSFPVQYSQQYQGMFGQVQQSPSQVQQSGPNAGHHFFPNQNFIPTAQQQPQQFFYPANQYPSQGQMYPTNALRSYPAQYMARGNLQGDGGTVGRQPSNEHLGTLSGESSGQGRAGSASSSISHPSIPRGPPRKPKQSGHALWVGNLPPGANVVDLKEHFSREATEDILSVFLISKSNCAFVNYRTEESCAAAMSRFHDSRFQGVRLVCRLRRSSVNAVTGVPTGPAALSAAQPTGSDPSPEADNTTQEAEISTDLKIAEESRSPAKDRYFIVKSLTVEDLELSVRNGIWATQSHNEEALNRAYESSEAVYLIFSANKSGEYFGYARMVSPINNDPAAAIEFAPKAAAVEDPDLPKAIPTPATDFAPKGRIIDDSARGTIFWEAEIEEVEGAVDTENPSSDHSDQEADDNSAKAWGKPFKLEWMSTNRLPFYRTRGLRNPWNSNREVKIARDGTELETSIGRRLVQMFHREPSPSAPPMPNMQMQMPPMMGGYPQMRQY